MHAIVGFSCEADLPFAMVRYVIRIVIDVNDVVWISQNNKVQNCFTFCINLHIGENLELRIGSLE